MLCSADPATPRNRRECLYRLRKHGGHRDCVAALHRKKSVDNKSVVYPSAPAPVFAAHAIVDLRVDCDEPRPRTQYEAPTQATHTLWHTGGGRAQEICRQSCYLCRAVHRHSRSVHRECLFMRICHPSRYRTGRVAACWTAACHALAFAMLAVTRCREATCNMAACSRTCSCA